MYIHLKQSSELPDISSLAPFKCVVVIEDTIQPERRTEISEWLVKSGCLYMMAWGPDSSTWDDSVDQANLDVVGYQEIPESKFVMTTWHDNEPLSEVFWFCKRGAIHPAVELETVLLLHLSNESRQDALESEFAGV